MAVVMRSRAVPASFRGETFLSSLSERLHALEIAIESFTLAELASHFTPKVAIIFRSWTHIKFLRL